ncbi:hypothetical protein PPYR_10456 [Photinus pyralis]|uniref:Uncharacterized protein n=1 Tax=Photinus pyralis TaxID=7054 RepID=A0A5N4AGD6_PHOPY|nr:uncharacterized protein LOC116173293 [Photinus pyralis]KAB0796395.1 hypothetical protein PPYR_10456 [Photinus pyralis]
MYFKLVIGLMCVGVISGVEHRYCHLCYGKSTEPKDFWNCRNFVNVTKVYDCTTKSYCVSFHETVKTKDGTYTWAKRTCSSDCAWYKRYNRADLYCSQCESDYCNKEKF